MTRQGTTKPDGSSTMSPMPPPTEAAEPDEHGVRVDPVDEADTPATDTPATDPPPVRSPGPISPRKWVQRAEGDRRSRARLEFLGAEGVVVLNDRRVPGSRTSIRCIAISSAGVFVVDAKNYKGLVHTMRPGPVWHLGPSELHVGRRNCTASVENLVRQADAVRTALEDSGWGSEVPVHPMLCLTRAEWGFASAVEIGDVCVGWPRLVAGRVQAPGVMDSPAVQEVSEMISSQLPTG